MVHFPCPTISSVPHCCTVPTVHRPSQFVLKMERFHYISVEKCMWKYGQEGFFLLTYVEPNIKAIHITRLVQIIFNTWFGYFEYVSSLPCGITLTVLNYCFDLITVNFNWSTHPVRRVDFIVQWEIPSMKLRKLLLTRSITAPSPYTAQIFFFAFQLCFYLSWNNKA